MNQEQNILQEGLLPMNFNVQQAKQRINQQQYPSSYPPGFDDPNSPNFNPMINMNDPEVRAQVDAQRKRDEESFKQQRIANYTQHARNILYKIINGVNNLIKGHSHPNFTESNQQMLCISISNKVNEILNENKLNIDNNILLNVLLENQVFMKEEYIMNIKRYNLINTETVGYNSETGQLMINPDYLFDIVKEWVNENFAHYHQDDQMIFG
jgi:hypothetical protein